ADYHGDSGTVMTKDRVLHWSEHFPKVHRLAVLNEMAHLLGKMYISQTRMSKFLAGVAKNEKITRAEPKKFWASTEILNHQQRGSSQREMVALLQTELAKMGSGPCQPGKSGTQS